MECNIMRQSFVNLSNLLASHTSPFRTFHFYDLTRFKIMVLLSPEGYASTRTIIAMMTICNIFRHSKTYSRVTLASIYCFISQLIEEICMPKIVCSLPNGSYQLPFSSSSISNRRSVLVANLRCHKCNHSCTISLVRSRLSGVGKCVCTRST